MVDETRAELVRSWARRSPPVELVPVDDPVAIVRASDRVVVLVGSGDGVIDAAGAGLLHGDEALAATRPTSHGRRRQLDGAVVIITDSNRDRAHHWRSSQDVTGFTETGGDGSDVLRIDEGDQRLPVFGPVPDADDQTIATLDGGLVVHGQRLRRAVRLPARAAPGDGGRRRPVHRVGGRRPQRPDRPLHHRVDHRRLAAPAAAAGHRRQPDDHVRAHHDRRAGAPLDVALDPESLTGRRARRSLSPPAVPSPSPSPGSPNASAAPTPGRRPSGFAELGLGASTPRSCACRSPTSTWRRGTPTRSCSPACASTRATAGAATPSRRSSASSRWPTDARLRRHRDRAAEPTSARVACSTRLDRVSDFATANRHLTGVPSAGGVVAADGDLDYRVDLAVRSGRRLHADRAAERPAAHRARHRAVRR